MRKSNSSKMAVLILSATLLLCLLCAVPASAGSQLPGMTTVLARGQTSSVTGGSSYSIPIAAPAGPGGIVPQLALSYSSVAVNEGQPTDKSYLARLGKGWSLMGLASIQRNGWGESYRLIMGGINEPLQLGTDGYYHTQSESFARIKKEGGYWWLKDRKGTYYRLGYSDASRHLTKKYEACGNKSVDFAWDVDLIEDAQGNQMTFAYTETKTRGDTYTINKCSYNLLYELAVRLTKVTYTLRQGAAIGRALTVEFNTEGDFSYHFSTAEGVDSWNNYIRYTGAVVKVDGVRQRKYVFGYNGGVTADYVLTSVREYGATDSDVLPATTFSYDAANMLTAVVNGRGGKKEFVYEKYTSGKTRYRVIQEKTGDGLGNVYTISYKYGTPRWFDGKFYGHDWVQTTDAGGSYTKSWYWQDDLKLGMVKQTETRSSAGALFGKTVNTYAQTMPSSSVVLTQVATATDGSVAGVDASNNVWLYSDGGWTKVGGEKMKQVALTGPKAIYGVNTSNQPWVWNGTIWYGVSPSISLKQISCAAGTDLHGKAIAYIFGVDTSNNALKLDTTNKKWVKLGKTVKQLDACGNNAWAVGQDGLVYFCEETVTTVGIPGDKSNKVTYSWTKKSTVAMKQVEAYSGAVAYAVDAKNKFYQYASGTAWTAKSSGVKQIAVQDSATVWGIKEDNHVYRWKSGSWCYRSPGFNFISLIQTDAYRYDGDATYKQTRTAYQYDSYGNSTKVSNLGDVSMSGDEVYSYTEYINDTTDWLLGVLKHNYVKASDDTTTVAESWNYYSDTYNGTVDYGAANKYLRKTEQAAVFGSRGNAANPTAQLSYDQYGNVTQATDALGNSATTTYDSIYHMFPVSATNALGQKTYTYYYGVNEDGDAAFTGSGLFGQVKSVKDINGKISLRVKYDGLGRPVAAWSGVFCGEFDATKPETTTGYVFWSSATSPNKIVTWKRKDLKSSACFSAYIYSDGMGRTIQTQTPSKEAGKMMVSGPVDYDKLGRVAKQYVGYKTASNGAYIAKPLKQNPTVFTYDAVGRVIRTNYPDGACNRVIYNDYVTIAVDKSGKQARSTVDAYGRVVKTETFKGNYPTTTVYSTTTNTYDDLGQLVKITDAQGNVNTITYDNLGRKVATVDMDLGKCTYQYDLLGQLISHTDAKGQTIAMTYDALGRQIKKTNPDGTYTQWDYDTFSGYTGSNGQGRLLRVYGTAMGQQPVTDVAYFDAYGRGIKTEKIVDGIAYVTQTAYDALNRVTYSTYPDGSKVYYTYNENNGGLEKIGSTAGGDQYLKSQVYNEYGLVTAKTLGNNVTLNYTYDPKNLRLTKVAATAGSRVVQNLSYTYDNSGLVTAIVDTKNNTNWSYAYDDLHRLTGAKRGSGIVVGTSDIYDKNYAYDNIGNITSFEGKSYSYGDSAHKHAVTLAGSDAYAYDANGNLTSGAGRTIAWNYANKPLAVTKAGVTTEFAYDGNGNRVKKATGANWKIYISGIYEKDRDGKETCYIDAAGVSVKKKSDGSLYFILNDHLSGANAITDAAGNVVTQQFYQPYGLDDTVGSFENEVDDHKFTGQEEDTETGLYNYNARLYDPALGRFISADPMQGINRYAYCGNNPINMIDPSGYYKYEPDRYQKLLEDAYTWYRQEQQDYLEYRADFYRFNEEEAEVYKEYMGKQMEVTEGCTVAMGLMLIPGVSESNAFNISTTFLTRYLVGILINDESQETAYTKAAIAGVFTGGQGAAFGALKGKLGSIASTSLPKQIAIFQVGPAASRFARGVALGADAGTVAATQGVNGFFASTIYVGSWVYKKSKLAPDEAMSSQYLNGVVYNDLYSAIGGNLVFAIEQGSKNLSIKYYTYETVINNQTHYMVGIEFSYVASSPLLNAGNWATEYGFCYPVVCNFGNSGNNGTTGGGSGALKDNPYYSTYWNSAGSLNNFKAVK